MLMPGDGSVGGMTGMGSGMDGGPSRFFPEWSGVAVTEWDDTATVARMMWQVLFRYGWIAWIWRPLILLAGVGGGILLALSVLKGSWGQLATSMPLLLPAGFFGLVVAVRIDRGSDGVIRVVTLSFWRRRIAATRIGRPKFRENAQTDYGSIHAPRLWVSVKGGLPIFIDLLGDIPDKGAFRKVFGRSPSWR